jgi:hypothetical protein
MKKITKYGFAFLFIAFNTMVVGAQSSELFADYTPKSTSLLFSYLIRTKVYNISDKQIHAQAVMQDNELAYNAIGQNAPFHTNPLQLNGQLLDYGNFDLNSRGFLAIVRGNPDSKDAQAVPFTVSIRRNGKIIENKKILFLNKTIHKINLAEILPFCKDGDLLILNPTRAEDWKAKRILKLLFGGC